MKKVETDYPGVLILWSTISGASLQRPELLRLLDDAAKGDAIIIEQIDRLSRLDEKSWFTLKEILHEKELKVISLDLPTSQIAFSPQITDEFTGSMIKAINSMMMDIKKLASEP